MTFRLTLVAAVMVAASADQSSPSGAASGPSLGPVYHQQPSAFQGYNNYYDNQYQSPSFLESIFGRTRRQGILGDIDNSLLFGLIAVAVVIGLGIALLIAAAALGTNIFSGRGLDSDDWEVNHSVWMDQLQRDFEDSWSTEQ